MDITESRSNIIKCGNCDFETNKDEEMNQHLEENHLHACDHCEILCNSEDILRKHKRETHQHYCVLCKEVFSDAGTLNSHFKETHACMVCKKDSKDKNFWKCADCSKSIHQKCAAKYLMIEDFQDIQKNPEEFTCDECSYKSKSVESAGEDPVLASDNLDNLDNSDIDQSLLTENVTDEAVNLEEEVVVPGTGLNEDNTSSSSKESTEKINDTNENENDVQEPHSKCKKCEGSLKEKSHIEEQLALSQSAYCETKKHLEASGRSVAEKINPTNNILMVVATAIDTSYGESSLGVMV